MRKYSAPFLEALRIDYRGNTSYLYNQDRQGIYVYREYFS